jgi:hypothetical protein
MRERNLVNMCSMFDAADDEVEENAENGVQDGRYGKRISRGGCRGLVDWEGRWRK